MRSLTRRVPTLMLAAAVLLACVTVAAACPTCKDSLAGDPASANLARGYFWSILFMMSMPFLILGSLVTYMYFEVRRARKLATRKAPAQAEAAGRAAIAQVRAVARQPVEV